MIPLLQPSVSQAEIDAVTAVLNSKWWGQGPECAKFERAVTDATGYAHCITVNSATAALHLALRALGVKPGDEVIVPALTFISTALAVTYCGARPIFCDVRPDTLTLDPADVARCVTEYTKAVIPVDYAGYPAFMPDMHGQFPTSWGAVVEDAAHYALAPHYGDLVCYSFHPVKNLATGDGGAILTRDATQAQQLRALRWCGIDKSTWERTGSKYNWDYSIGEVGYKAHWNDIQAALGLVQLGRLPAMNARRRAIAGHYLAALDLPGIQLPCPHPLHAWHLFVIRVDAARRNALLDHLAAHGVSAGVHYKPLTLYQPYGWQITPPITAREWPRMVSLPIYADMTEREQEQVIDAVSSFFR